MSFNKVIYGGRTLIDLTADTVTEDSLLEGYTAHKADGSIITGKFKGGSETEEIDRILTSGLTDGYKYFLDDGTIISNDKAGNLKLTKTFSNNFKTCTTILTNEDGTELGRTVKNYSDDYLVITTIDHLGRKLVKTFNTVLKTCVSVLTDAEGVQLAKQTKTFSDDGSIIETEVVYGSQTS